MIKQLIKDIAYDNIKLSQALTRAKIVESKIKNQVFKSWLNKELEGYEFLDDYLPSYRKVSSNIELIVEFPFGRQQTISVDLPESFGQKTLDYINFHRITEPISIVEAQISNMSKPSGSLNLSVQQVNMFSELYKSQILEYNGVITSGYRKVGKVQYQNVLEQTKQKLLDTLIELESEFPNILDDQIMSKADNEKAQNIITTNIYGNNNPLNIAAGSNVNQQDFNVGTVKTNFSELEKYGVHKEDIEALKNILVDNNKDKSKLKGQVMKWLGNVSSSIAGRGLYDNIPAITDFVTNLL